MSFTRLVIYASFAGSLIALSVQPSGIANATEAAAFLVMDPPSSSSQDADSHRKNMGKSSPESSGKMQSDEKGPLSGGGNMDPGSKMEPRLKHENNGTSEGSKRQDSHSGGSSGTSTIPGYSNTNTGPGSK
jgi:hypothetical protein